MSNKVIQCPHCGGQRIIFNVTMQYLQHYTIDGGRLYKTHAASSSQTDSIWLRCIECSQKEEFEKDGGEWFASYEERQILKEMMFREMSADVSELLKIEYK